MKPFAFSLARMRHYKEQVLNKEKNELAKLNKHREEIKQNIRKIENYRIDKSNEINLKSILGVSPFEMSSYKFFMENTKHQLEGLAKDLIKADEDVAKQLKVVIEASKDLNGLDKLEEKQLEEYRVLAAKEEENTIAEHVTVSMVRKKVSQ